MTIGYHGINGWLVAIQRPRMMLHDVITPTYTSSIIGLGLCSSSLSLL